MNILIINGPNLNLLGKRNTEVYGNEDFDSILKAVREEFTSHQIDYYQSNIEGEIINELQKADSDYHAIVLNAGGYTHTSVAIGDAVEAIDCPVIEVHISNIYAREDFRHKSYISAHAKGIIAGLGPDVYHLAIESLVR